MFFYFAMAFINIITGEQSEPEYFEIHKSYKNTPYNAENIVLCDVYFDNFRGSFPHTPPL